MLRFLKTADIAGFQIGVVPYNWLSENPPSAPVMTSVGSFANDLWDYHLNWLPLWSEEAQKPVKEHPVFKLARKKLTTRDEMYRTFTIERVARSGFLAPGWAYQTPAAKPPSGLPVGAGNGYVLYGLGVPGCEEFIRVSGGASGFGGAPEAFVGESACGGQGIRFEEDPAHPNGGPIAPERLAYDADNCEEEDAGSRTVHVLAVASLNFKSMMDLKTTNPGAREQVVSALQQSFAVNRVYFFDSGAFVIAYLPFRREEPPGTVFTRPGDYRLNNAQFLVAPPDSFLQSYPIPQFPEDFQTTDAGSTDLPDFVYYQTIYFQALYNGIPSYAFDPNADQNARFPGSATFKITISGDKKVIAYPSCGSWVSESEESCEDDLPGCPEEG